MINIFRNKAHLCIELFKYYKNFATKRNALIDNRFDCRWSDRWPCLNDVASKTEFDKHYVYHTSWAARVLADTKPAIHVDISSCLRFVSLVSAFVPIKFYDYRPADILLSGVTSKHADLTSLEFESNSIESLSCMHVVEHIGLERYGDPFDPSGDLKAMSELSRVLARKGQLLFVVPVGEYPRIHYNAHRVYTPNLIVKHFSDLSLVSFAIVKDSGDFLMNANFSETNGQRYSCGCFHFTKL